MAIICLRLEAEAKLSLDIHRPFESTVLPCPPLGNFNVQISEEEPRRMGDYRDILSLTRVLVHGPESKTDVDALIERRYLFLITFRSYLYCCSPAEITFSEWMDARPELGHLCDNLRIDI
ncbi:hypothetical protein RND71_001648 [Anisodus tanguticus]|uniref:Uncharacterized protein n=1 Tax=Anisodus tanguticus TaxID=243964 RepID=A0AAE1T1I8_9SOLA|nr:hypothetical protein RND71_001648 [Anisodus tanguticus]